MVLEFDGLIEYVDLGDDPLFWSRPLTKLSFSFWVYITSPPDANSRWVVSHGGTSNQGFRCIYETDGKLTFVIKDSVGTNFIASTTAAVPTNKWIFCVCVYDNSLGSANLKIYTSITTGNDTSMQVGGTTANLTETINLAATLRLSESSNDLQGYMKDFKFWKSKAVSSAEVTQLFEGKDETQIEPDYWLPMDETEDNPESWGLRAIRNGNVIWNHNSIFMNGSDIGDYLNCGKEPTLWSKSLTKFSFSFFIRPQSINDANRYIISLTDGSNNVFTFALLSGGNGSFEALLTSDGFISFAQVIPNGIDKADKWYHVVVTYDNTVGLKVYLDKTLKGSAVYTNTIAFPSTTQLLIGKYEFATTNINYCGDIKEIMFWNNTALTQQQINDLFDDNITLTPQYRLKCGERTGQPNDAISNPRTGTLVNGCRWAYPDSNLLTSDPSYQFRVGHKIVIKRNDEDQTYFRYDSFGSKPFKVLGLQLTMGDSETDMAVLVIEDNDDILDDTKLSQGCKYFISLAAGETVPYEDMFVGYGEMQEIRVESTNHILKVITIFGSKILATYRYLNYFRSAKLNDLQDPTSVNDISFASWFHVDRAISKTSELLYDKIIIKDKAGWDDIDLHRDVDTILSGISLGTVTLWDFMEFQKSITGAKWGTDFFKKTERFYYMFPEYDQTNIILKSAYEKTASDKANQVSWVYAPFSRFIDTTKENNATILHGITDVDDVFISGSSVVNGANNLTFKALVQYLPLPAEAKRITKLNLMLSMKGEVTSPQNKVNGVIRLPDANGKPLGKRLDKFEIPLSDIKKNPEVISVTLDIDPDDIQGNTEVCIVLYNRSGTDEEDKGDPNHDEKNTILWHHNNITNTAGQYKSGSATKGDRSDEPLSWIVSDKGPQYACSIHSNIQMIQTLLTTDKFNTLGVKEQIINVSDLRDKKTVNNFLAFKGYIMALPKIYIPSIRAQIVNNKFFRPNKLLFMTILKPKINSQVRIKRVTYNIDPINEQAGTNRSSRICTLALEEIYNPADHEKFNCEY